MNVIDHGHEYNLLILDGVMPQTLKFVKREGVKFPGNIGHHQGTTMQSVIRALIERVRYLNNQIADKRNCAVEARLHECLWLLEDRAAERHGLDFDFRVEDIYEMPMCKHCGHVVCPQMEVEP